jgi:hypothetical protein
MYICAYVRFLEAPPGPCFRRIFCEPYGLFCAAKARLNAHNRSEERLSAPISPPAPPEAGVASPADNFFLEKRIYAILSSQISFALWTAVGRNHQRGKKNTISKLFCLNPLISLNPLQGKIWKKLGKSLEARNGPLKSFSFLLPAKCLNRAFQGFRKSGGRLTRPSAQSPWR